MPLAIWTASSGTWISGTDVRSAFGRDDTYVSTGLISVQSQGLITLSVDSSLVSLRVAVPAHSANTCTAGVWATDGNYYYLCVAANSWMRAALSTF
jgi:hypothetical protein